MKKALQVAMFSLFTVIGFNAQANEHHHETMSEAQPQVISATGVVKTIDLESKKITIHHAVSYTHLVFLVVGAPHNDRLVRIAVEEVYNHLLTHTRYRQVAKTGACPRCV